MKEQLSIKAIKTNASSYMHKAKPYSFVIFLVVVGATYGFLVLRIQTLSDAQPSEDTITSQVQAAGVPRIDPAVIQQLTSLQDNSVSVKALFDEARTNPFNQ